MSDGVSSERYLAVVSGRRQRVALWLGLALWLAPAAVWGAAAETWITVKSKFFTVITPASETQARTWAVELEQFRRGLQTVFGTPEARLQPVTVILFKTDRAMRAFKQLEQGKPADQAGVFVRVGDQNAIALALDSNLKATRRVIFHEAVHWHSSANDRELPAWLEEGLAEVYSSFELRDGNRCAFGDAILEHVAFLGRERPMPLEKLMLVPRRSIEFNERTRVGRFYAQSWAFVHYLLFSQNTGGGDALKRYVDRLFSTGDVDRSFREAFGADFAEMDARLRKYLTNGRYTKRIYAFERGDVERELEVAKAGRWEVDLALGTLLLGTRTPDEAEPYLRRAAEARPRDPRPYEALAHIALVQKRIGDAVAYWHRAEAAGSRSYLVYHNLAASRRRADVANSGLILTGDERETEQALRDYLRALELNAQHLPAYEGLAGLLHGPAEITPAVRTWIARGRAAWPESPMLRVGEALVLLRAGDRAEAIRRIDALLEEPGLSRDVETFARSVLEAEAWRDDAQKLTRLFEAQRYREAVTLADEALARKPQPMVRQQLQQIRLRAIEYDQISDAITLINEQKIAAGRVLLETVAKSGADAAARTEARRLLLELGKAEGRQKSRR